MQVLFAIPSVQNYYYHDHPAHIQNCYEVPANCFRCQMGKLGHGILSGNYSIPRVDDEQGTRGQDGISPSMFKSVIGKGHSEFLTMRQQDAQEFLQHVLTTINQKENASNKDPSGSFRFKIENRLQCLDCEHCQYSTNSAEALILPVPAVPTGAKTESGKIEYQSQLFIDLLANYFEPEMREYSCSIDKTKTTASYISRIQSFPEYLVCVASRFVLGEGWVMEKLNVKITAPHQLSLDQFRAVAKSDGELLFPADATNSQEPTIDQDALNALLGMGFPENRCKRALIKTGNNGADVAMNWLFEHMEDPDIDDPIAPQGSASGASDADLAPLMDMGFSKAHAQRAFKETV